MRVTTIGKDRTGPNLRPPALRFAGSPRCSSRPAGALRRADPPSRPQARSGARPARWPRPRCPRCRAGASGLSPRTPRRWIAMRTMASALRPPPDRGRLKAVPMRRGPLVPSIVPPGREPLPLRFRRAVAARPLTDADVLPDRARQGLGVRRGDGHEGSPEGEDGDAHRDHAVIWPRRAIPCVEVESFVASEPPG